MGTKIRNIFFVVSLLSILSACATAPNSCQDDGVNCYPVHKVVRKVEERSLTDLPGLPKEYSDSKKGKHQYVDNQTVSTSSNLIKTITSSDPLLTLPRQWRLWINRFQDSDGDWNDETYIVLRLDKGRWRIGIDASTLGK